MRNGQIIKDWSNYLGAFLIFASLCLPVVTLKESLPSIHVLDICLPFVLYYSWKNRANRLHGKYQIIPFLFAAYVMFTILIQKHPTSTSDYFEVYKWIKFGIVCMFFTLIDLSKVERFIPWILACLIGMNILHFIEFPYWNQVLEKYYNGGMHLHFFGKDSEGAPAVKRLVGTMGNPNINAILFGLISIYYFPVQLEKRRVILYFTCLLFVFLCQSRTALLVLGASYLYLAVFHAKIWTIQQWLKMFLGIVIVFFIAWMLATSFFQYTSYNNSLLDGSAFRSGSARGRFETWKLLGGMIIQHPILGYGPFKNYFYTNRIFSENEYILMMWRYGVIGLLLYVSIFLYPLKKIIQKADLISIQGSLLLILMLVSALSNNPLTERNIEIVFCLGLAWVMKSILQKESVDGN